MTELLVGTKKGLFALEGDAGKAFEITEAGHRSTKGADPPGFSAAICQIS